MLWMKSTGSIYPNAPLAIKLGPQWKKCQRCTRPTGGYLIISFDFSQISSINVRFFWQNSILYNILFSVATCAEVISKALSSFTWSSLLSLLSTEDRWSLMYKRLVCQFVRIESFPMIKLQTARIFHFWSKQVDRQNRPYMCPDRFHLHKYCRQKWSLYRLFYTVDGEQSATMLLQ